MPKTSPRIRLSAVARTAGGEVFTSSRLLLAAKTALAAAIAWYLAPLVPFASSEYSYYAPLGVLVSMYPTVADSARAGVQALVGLAIGIALGLVAYVIVTGPSPQIVGVALVAGVGVALSGIRALGTGRDWIALAALFVLLLGARDPEGYSTSYLVTMAFGVLVGVVVNLVVVPPIYVRKASTRLSTLRDDVAATLERIADDTRAGTEPDAQDRLITILNDVTSDVYEAERSRRANPMGRLRRATSEENNRRLRALERAVRQTIELTFAVSDLETGPDAEPHRRRLADAMRATATTVSMSVNDTAMSAAVDSAERELARFVREAPGSSDGRVTAWARSAVCLDRIIDTARRFL